MAENREQIIRTEYSEIMQKSYIDYAMSVIIARALPDVRDGLKPVQRRTLYLSLIHIQMCISDRYIRDKSQSFYYGYLYMGFRIFV